MSDADRDLTGSAAREHETAGGNVEAGKLRLPAGGDAARKAETEGEAVNQAYGVGAVPSEQYRGKAAIRLPLVRGARLVDAEIEPDFSTRKASDYLPPQLKAQLIAEGKLSGDGSLPPLAKAAPPPETVPPLRATGEGALASVTRFFRKIFG